MALDYITLVLDLADGTGTPLATGQALLNLSAQLTDAADAMIVTKAQLSAILPGSYPQARLLATDNTALRLQDGRGRSLSPGRREPSAVYVLLPGQLLLLHRDQRQPGRVHCRRQLLCQRHAGRAHRVVAARRVHRRVRWRPRLSPDRRRGRRVRAGHASSIIPANRMWASRGTIVLVAMRDISPGEELTTDYALFDDYDGMMQSGAERHPAAPRSAAKTGSGQTCSASTATTSLLISCTG